jgi:hypothetical protein
LLISRPSKHIPPVSKARMAISHYAKNSTWRIGPALKRLLWCGYECLRIAEDQIGGTATACRPVFR